MKKSIKITWKAFGDQPERKQFISSVQFDLHTYKTDAQILNDIYEATNLQDELADFGRPNEAILLWKTIEVLLSPTRTHTSLSIFDEIIIDDSTYEVGPYGFAKLVSEEVSI